MSYILNVYPLILTLAHNALFLVPFSHPIPVIFMQHLRQHCLLPPPPPSFPCKFHSFGVDCYQALSSCLFTYIHCPAFFMTL